MTTTDDDYLDDEQDDQENHNLRRLREKAKKFDTESEAHAKTKAELEAVKRGLAFVKAGIDTDTGSTKWFAKAYDGELTPEAIRAAAIADGLIEAESDADLEENEARDQVRAARAGASPSNSHEITPADVAARRKDPGFSEWWRSLPTDKQRALKEGKAVTA